MRRDRRGRRRHGSTDTADAIFRDRWRVGLRAALATRRSILLVHLVATTIAFEFDYNSRAAERRDRARF